MGLTLIHKPGATRGENRGDVSVELVFIHGLGGDPILTWRTQDSGVNWVTDFLPQDPFFKSSKILSFGYDSGSQEAKAEQSVPEFALDLLRQVHHWHQASYVSLIFANTYPTVLGLPPLAALL
jgi:hypothetical protein